jgi:hypothetical protein
VADYTVVNLNEVEDQAPKFGLAPDLQARFAAASLGLGKSGVSLQRLAGGFRMPFGHRQDQQEELYVIVRAPMERRSWCSAPRTRAIRRATPRCSRGGGRTRP